MKDRELKLYFTSKFAFTLLSDIVLLICGFLLAKSYLIYLAAVAVCFLLTIIIPEGQRIHLKLDARSIPVIKTDRLDWVGRILLWILVISLIIGFVSQIPSNLVLSLVLMALITVLCYTVSGICFLIAFILVDFQRRKRNIRRSPAQSVIITVFDVIVCHLFSVLITLALIPFLYTNIVLMFSVEASLFALSYLFTQIPVYFYAKRMEQGRPNRWSRA